MGEVFPDIGVLVGLYSLGRNVDCDAAVEGSFLFFGEFLKAEEVGFRTCIVVILEVRWHSALAVNVGENSAVCVVGKKLPASECAKAKHIDC